MRSCVFLSTHREMPRGIGPHVCAHKHMLSVYDNDSTMVLVVSMVPHLPDDYSWVSPSIISLINILHCNKKSTTAYFRDPIRAISLPPPFNGTSEYIFKLDCSNSYNENKNAFQILS